ncbi:MAG: stage II sporulation protein P, partial [Bacilli bacterium]|nr:stage II sporulation protein P [Bacilli bacterium]
VSKAYLLEGGIGNLKKISLNSEKILLSLGLNYKTKSKDREVSKDDKTEVPVFSEKDIIKPRIYIYNTHQTEEYTDGNVYEAAKYIADILNKKDLEVVVEDTNIKKALEAHNYNYNDSYKITRELLTKNINDKTILYIDLHRDSSSYDVSTVEVNGEKMARMMFVVGGKHETSTRNYQVSDELNKKLKNKNNKLSRGIYVRESSSYNQDLNSNVILIEVGGPHNSMEEVKRSLAVLADVIWEYVGD